MDTTQINTLREEFAGLHNQANDLLKNAADAKRDLTAEEKEQNTKRFARMTSIKQQVDDAKRLAEFSLANGEAELPQQPKGKVEFDNERTGKIEFDKDAYRAAVNHFARTGDMSHVQKFTITTGTAGGVFLPKEVIPSVQIKRLPNAFRQLLDYFDYKPITRQLTESIAIPVADDTAVVGQQIAQNTNGTTAVDADLSGSITLNPTLYTSKQIWVANTVINAVDFDVFSWVQPQLQRRIDKAQESAWATNLKTFVLNGKTTASATAFTYQEWLAFESSLPPSYRDDAGFIVSDAVYQNLRGLVDNNNRPIVDLDPANNWQTTMHGKPLIVSEYVDGLTASKSVAAFISCSAMFIFDAGPQRIARYVLNPDHSDQTGFEIFQNGDCQFVPTGVSVMRTHA